MRHREAYPVYLIMTGASSLFFAMIATVNLVYQTKTVGLNPLQLVLVGTLLEAVCFLCQVPTGVLADVYGRRLAVVAGTFLIGAGFMLEGAVPHFTAVLAAQVLWGLGATLTDGADAAWIADEIGEAGIGRTYLRGSQVAAFAGLLGIGASVALASIRLNLPVLLGGALYCGLGLFLLLCMPEHNFTPVPRGDRTGWQTMAHTARSGLVLIRRRPVLLTILAIGAFYGMFTEGFDRLWQYHFLHHLSFPSLGTLEPVVWFGIIGAVAMLLNIGAAEVARRRIDTDSHRLVARALLGIDMLMLIGALVLGLAGAFAPAVLGFWVVSTARATRRPLEMAWINQSLEPGVRATLLSVRGQVDALSQILGGPIIGALATVFSTSAGLVVASLLLVPAIPLYARTMRHNTGPGA